MCFWHYCSPNLHATSTPWLGVCLRELVAQLRPPAQVHWDGLPFQLVVLLLQLDLGIFFPNLPKANFSPQPAVRESPNFQGEGESLLCHSFPRFTLDHRGHFTVGDFLHDPPFRSG